MARQAMTVVLSLSVASSLLFGGLVHATTPHDHGNDALWSALHTTVRHENNSTPAIIPTTVFLVAAIFLSVQFAVRLAPPGKLQRALRRGIVAYRRFG